MNDAGFEPAISGVVRGWTATDSEAASEWLQRLPKGSRKDFAAAEFATTLARIDKRAAREVVNWIEDSKLKAKILAKIGK